MSLETAPAPLARTSAPLRALFVNQGALGSGVQGHGATEEALRIGLQGTDDLVPRYLRLSRWTRGAELMVRPLPGLGRFDADFKALRWHAVESVRGRRAVLAALDHFPADVVHITSHTPALLMSDVMRRVPTLLCVDASIDAWERMAIWRSTGRFSRFALAPSRMLERRAYRNAAAVVCMSEWSAGTVRCEDPEARTVTIHPGLDLTRFRPAPRAGRTRSRVLFVGGRFQAKGGDDLLDALRPELGRTVDLDLVTGDTVPELPGVTVHRLNHADPRLVELYQQADVLCLPTHGDAVPWTVLEAMACGTAVVSTAVGAIPELLQDGAGGLVVPMRQPRQLASALRQALSDRSRRDAMIARGLELVARRFDARRQARALVELCREVTRAPSGGAVRRSAVAGG